MNFLNKGNEIPFEQVMNLHDGTKVYVESIFPDENRFVGIKKANQIFMPDGKYWVLAADYKALCKTYEYLETNIY